MERDRAIEEIAREVPSPCYLIDTHLVRRNLEILAGVKRRTGCKVLLALKAFAMWSLGELVGEYLDGTSASSLFEARLGAEQFGGEVHICSPAYNPEEIDEIAATVDHVVFNSLGQFEWFGERLMKSRKKIEIGLRINPMHSEVTTAIYDPCAKGSRLGVRVQQLGGALPDGIDGLHFHTLCEKNADALERTLESVESQFRELLSQVKWVNFGGGHHITREDYDVNLLCRLVNDFKQRYGAEVYLEPGEAVALNAGFLVATVLDIVHNDVDIAVLDTSASAHMPDVLEMPYRPGIMGGGEPGEREYTYRLGGATCLAGDVIGDYSFDEPLEVGSRLVFGDMAHYTMVKNTMFNGLRLPDIVVCDSQTGEFRVQRRFSYEDYKGRLS